MQVLFSSRHPDGNRMREFAIRRTKFVMKRLDWLIARARIQLADMNGPRKGVDKMCQIELATTGSGTVVVTATAEQWHSALDDALQRASRMLLRHRQRRSVRGRATLRRLDAIETTDPVPA